MRRKDGKNKQGRYVGADQADGEYAIYFFFGIYDIPLKASDKESLRESEEIYPFLICAVCPVSGDYEPGAPECGFLFPAFKERSGDTNRINIFQADKKRLHKEILSLFFPGNGAKYQ